MTTTPTAEQIAREAAEQLAAYQWASGQKAVEDCYTIILTAARKIAAGMVRESGAIPMLQDALHATPCYGEAARQIKPAIAKLRAIAQPDGEGKV